MAIADKPAELSEQVIESVKEGQQAALEAVRRFVDTVDQTLPLGGDEPSRRQTSDRFWSRNGRPPRPGTIQFPPQRRPFRWPVARGRSSREVAFWLE